MNTHEPQQTDIGDANVERLLQKAYRPEQPDPKLLPRVTERMLAAAGQSSPVEPAPFFASLRRGDTNALLTLLTSMAAMVAGVLLIGHALYPVGHDARKSVTRQMLAPSVTRVPGGSVTEVQHLTPRARPADQPAKLLKVGDTVAPVPQPKRFTLPDNSLLYVNRNTAVDVLGERELRLERGEVFVEVHPSAGTAQRFVVHTKQRTLTALGTKFDVQATADGKTGVLVAQGKVDVSGYDQPVEAGQQLEPGQERVTQAPRVTHQLDWTRELMAAADSPLVPGSKHAGGALIAVDPNGQEAKLSLRKYHIDVHIEDGFARTVIDQTYFNQTGLRMEGTFYFPLPADAQLSRLAMYVDGELREGGMTERNYARTVYEEILYSQRDPALLEWVDGSTFKMRVFALEARQEKRILIGYTQKLSSLYGRSQYRFPAGHTLGQVNDWSFHAHIKNGKDLVVSTDSHRLMASGGRKPPEEGQLPALEMQRAGDDLTIDGKEKNARLDRDVTLNLVDPTGGAGAARFNTSTDADGNRYVMLRYRPPLTTQARRQSRDWIFLYESSGDRDPLLARVQIEIIRTLLANAEHGDRFAILSAGTRVQSFAEENGLLSVKPENVHGAIRFLESAHLIGALDVAQALSASEPFVKEAKNPYLVHVGSGIAALGERRPDVLAKKIQALRPDVRYVGIGVGKRWSRDFMKTAADRTGGYFTQINPDEPIGWRAFDLAATLNTPRLLNVEVHAQPMRPKSKSDNSLTNSDGDFLLFANSLAQGEELCAVARFAPGRTGGVSPPSPTSLVVTGTVDGTPYREEIPIPPAAGQPNANDRQSSYLLRAWARLEIDRLLAEDAQKNRDSIIALSKAMYVMSPFTSLLVLENDEMYERFRVDRGRKDHWAPYVTPAKVPVVYEPEAGQVVDRFAPQQAKPHVNQVLETILVRVPAPLLVWPNRSERFRGQHHVAALQLYRGAFAMPAKNGDVGRLKDLNLTNDDIGNDPDISTNYNVDRLEDAIMLGGRLGALRERNEGERLSLGDVTKMPGRHFSSNGRASFAFFEKRSAMLHAEDRPTGRYLQHRPVYVPPSPDFPLERETREIAGKWQKDADISQITITGNLSANTLASPDGFNDLHASVPARARAEDEVFQRVDRAGRSRSNGPPQYGRPAFSRDERVFSDLVAYASGLNTSNADIEAVLETEAAPSLASLPGRIDPEARPLIERARKAGWQVLTVPQPAGDLKISFDGQGRYAYERTTPMGVRELVVCDGTTLVHLYPELDIGSRRPYSRFHRAEFARHTPWLVAPVEDLARGHEVKKAGDHSVAIIPSGAAERKTDEGKPIGYLYTVLVFADTGRLAERRLLSVSYDKEGKPKEQLHYVESYEPAGVVKLADKDGKELSKREHKITAGTAPNLTPDVSGLVVLPLPWRSREHVYKTLNIDPNQLQNADENWTFEFLEPEKALMLIAAEFAQREGWRCEALIYRCFQKRGINLPGFFTLLLSLNQPVGTDRDFLELVKAKPGDPLVRYLALEGSPLYRQLQQRFGVDLGTSVGPRGHFLERLAALRDLQLRWQRVAENNRGTAKERQACFQQALAYIQREHSVLGWAMLTLLQDRAEEKEQPQVAETWKLFAKDPELGYVARYEQARSLLYAGKNAEAARLFHELYVSTLKQQVLPPIDGSFRQALLIQDKDGWSELMRQTAQQFIKDKQRLAVVALAWQCRQLDDAPLAENLTALALRDPAGAGERLLVTAAVIEYQLATSQDAAADELVKPLLADATLVDKPALWRLASVIAERRQDKARSIACLETALELEFRDLPEVINLEQVRQDYGRLLAHYEWLAGAIPLLKLTPPADLLAKTVRAADRWRALAPGNGEPSTTAGKILHLLGAHELAWDYMTTVVAMKPNDAGPWRSLATQLSKEGELELANRAYAAAFAAEPTDAEILWEQAQNLRRAGKTSEADGLLRTIVNSDWQPRFNSIKSQARWKLEGR